MNDHFETTHHLKSLIPNSSGFTANINIPNYINIPKIRQCSPNKYRKKFKGKEENREIWENRVQLYKDADLSRLYNEISLIDWDHVKILKKSSKCPYCNLAKRTTKDHFIPTYYRKCIYYQNKIELSNEKMVIIKCCKQCNSKKGNLLPSEWLKDINNIMKESKSVDRYYLNIKENLMNILRMP